MLVRDLHPEPSDTDDRLVLTAAHPSNVRPSLSDGVPLGTLRRRVPLVNLPEIAVDAAVIKPRPGVQVLADVAGGRPSGVRDLWVDHSEDVVSVQKLGACTGHTRGSLLPANATHFMRDVQAAYNQGWWIDGDAQLFATEGDSGSIVVDEERAVIGMAVATERAGTDPTIACFCHGIKQIFRALGVHLPP